MLRGYGRLSYEERLRKIGLPTLEYRRLRSDLIQVYRLFSGIDRVSPTVFFSLFRDDEEVISDRVVTRGNSRKIQKERYVRRLRKDSFAYRVVNPWNKLDNDVVLAPNINIFKSKLNIHYKNHALKFVPSFMASQ